VNPAASEVGMNADFRGCFFCGGIFIHFWERWRVGECDWKSICYGIL